MGIIASIKNAVTTEQHDFSRVRPTRNDAVDSQLIVLLLITALGSDAAGVKNGFWFGQYLFQIEEELVDKGVDVNRYDWQVKDYPHYGGKSPYSPELADHLDLFVKMNDEQPVLHRKRITSYHHEDTLKYRPTGHTDLYIRQFAANTTVKAQTVESAIRDVFDEYGDMSCWDYNDELVKKDPERYFSER